MTAYLTGKEDLYSCNTSDELAAKIDKSRRNRIAEQFAYALTQAGGGWDLATIGQSLKLADALIAELDK